ncbi:MAG: NADH:flavin oxidoreductase [Acidimicrobiia bacterium]|nr:NADH:flavin oxidoreductase [Acidimicrobiia bacterium]
MSRTWPQVKKLGDPDALRARLAELDVDLPVDDEVQPAPDGVLASPFEVAGRTVGNRFAVLPMEGWDATADGRPTELLRRRWRRFGESGAKLVWGGEAVAVRHDGRANPNQLCIGPHSVDDLAGLRAELVAAHERTTGRSDDLFVGLQLTHSGRWARPDGQPAPRTALRHPVLDARVGLDDEAAAAAAVLDDDELAVLTEDFVTAAQVAADAGFDFVDLKACHGYLAHELLAAANRSGAHGGDLAARARFHLDLVAAVRERCPDLAIGVRLSVYDVVPYRPGPDGVGVPEPAAPDAVSEPLRFGGRPPWTSDRSVLEAGPGGGGPAGERSVPERLSDTDAALLASVDLAEPSTLVGWLADAGVSMLCVTAGSPYLNPHVQRPAFFPPSDGYQPPEDPLVGVARMQVATRELARRHPQLTMVGSGLSYLQDFFGNVAQPLVADGWMSVAGLGRMVLSYPELPVDLLAGRPVARRKVCRTFSDCTTAPRNGLVSGCYPLDEHYKELPERVELAAVKKRHRAERAASGIGDEGASS